MHAVDRSKSLEQLEGDVWPHNDFESRVVQESQHLRKIPLNELTVEDLRLLIGQRIGLPFVIPIALEHLADDPLVAGTYFRGDLLKNVLAVPASFWEQHPDLNGEMVEIGVELRQLHEATLEFLPLIERFSYRSNKC